MNIRIQKILASGLHLIALLVLICFFVTPATDTFALNKKKRSSVVKHSKSIKRAFRSVRTVRSAPSYRITVGRQSALQALRASGSSELILLSGISDEQFDNAETAEVVEANDSLIATLDEDIEKLHNEDDIQVDLESFKMLWLSYVDPTLTSQDNRMACGVEKHELMSAVMSWLGTPYVFGGVSRRGIDCSAFVRSVFAQAANIELPRTAQAQVEVGSQINRVNDLRFGDIIFFHTANHAYVSHVGIYLGDNLFAHASSKQGVTISSLQNEFYIQHILAARRITKNDVVSRAISGEARW